MKYGRFPQFCVLIAVGVMSAGAAMATAPAGFVDATTFGGFNATDSTITLQAAIDSGLNVYVPKMSSDWIVAPITLSHSNQQILFESGVVVSAKTGAFNGQYDNLFKAVGVSNVTLSGYGATFRMNQSEYVPLGGEWRHGISLFDVSNVQVKGLTIQNTGGDGIYVGGKSYTQEGTDWYSTDVSIKDVRLENNYRQGISVTGVDGLMVDNVVVLNTNGTAPKAGIDLEPSNYSQQIKNVTIQNSIFASNGGSGIKFDMNKIGARPDKGLPSKVGDVTATIEHVTVYNNGNGGIDLREVLPGLTVKNSIVIGNQYGMSAYYPTDGAGNNSIDYSLLFNNSPYGNVYRNTDLGSYALTTINGQPLFYSTDPNSPYFLWLDENVWSSIATGADHGGYMGARPLFGTVVPEPAMLSVLGLGGLLLVKRRGQMPKSEKGIGHEAS